MSIEEPPELSVIVPVYNEEANAASFLNQMALQRGVRFEVIFCDGGSTGNSVESIASLPAALPFPVTVLHGEKGRARQMNLGARAARAAILLFLHVDSSFPDPLSFRKGLDTVVEAGRKDHAAVAARFSLQFHFDTPPPLPYRFYGAKATLDRKGCTHGDQGLMIPKAFFETIGPFDESLPLMEDTFLAEAIRRAGTWLLLPARISTSPRRFVSEGLLPRQTLNAIVMNLADIGQMKLVESLKGCYRSQDATGRLDLAPFLVTLEKEIAGLCDEERKRLWYDTGRYVRSNAWQISFFMDVVMGQGGEGKGGICLALHDRIFDRLTGNRPCNWFTAFLVWAWFRTLLMLSKDR